MNALSNSKARKHQTNFVAMGEKENNLGWVVSHRKVAGKRGKSKERRAKNKETKTKSEEVLAGFEPATHTQP